MKSFVAAIFLIAIITLTLTARADDIYGDIAGNIVGSGYGMGPGGGVNNFIAEGFTMTGTYNLQSVDIILSLFSSAQGSNFALSIFSDNNGPNTDLYDLSTNVTGSAGAPADANFTGSGSFILNAGTKYWLELYATNPASQTGSTLQWDGEFSQITPTTVFATPSGPGATEIGQLRTFSGGVTTSELRTAFQLNGVLVPEPSSLILLGLSGLSLFGFCNRSRS